MHGMWNILKKTDFRIFKSLVACYKYEDNGCQTRQVTLWWKMFKIVPWVVQMKADGQWPRSNLSTWHLPFLIHLCFIPWCLWET